MRRKDNVLAWISLLKERAATWQRRWRKRFLRRVRLRNDKGACGFGMTRGGSRGPASVSARADSSSLALLGMTRWGRDVCNARFFVASAPLNDKMEKNSAT